MTDRQEKKAQFEQQGSNKKPLLVVAAVVVAALLAVAGWGLLGGGSGGYPAVAAQNGMVSIPAAQVSDGKAHFFSFRDGNATINFFVLKSSDGVIRAAFDACDVCFRDRLGYRQDGDSMVCIACNQRFASTQINELKGGCNPAPLDRVVRDGMVLIAEADIKAGVGYFPPTTR
ncbi:DUF2318 domain-containing protein [Geoalkalibacter halelectricus]|uniref:DUF2318 domain-containing protein n=1 Tax=Geoalkalibacter halelectricus TaxID=2847045 RepID=A0ABY5ZLB2_9BACT|nr:DUF2318 domain-containing protein [Geoalkalibacter halelectricus]MDO3379365.1 DUF2318 domain-containing protein [Geoalkalibacter halelectricus]UWZ78757.1 DUF2318 domain-containing protein [Geoalkalibacter halelectricus]